MSTRKRKLSASTTSSKMYKRLYKKQKRSSRPYVRSLLQVGVPEEMTIKLVYHDSYTHTHTSGAIQLWEFRANSVYDPDYTYTGHQPTGFDEMAALYQRYLVTGCKIEVEASPLSSSGSSVPIVVAILPRLEQNSITDINTVVENPKAISTVVTGNVADANQHYHLSKYINVAKLFGVKSVQDDLDYSSVVTSNPTAVAFYSLYSNSANGSSTSIVALTVTLTYWVKFYKRQTTTST